MLNERQAVRIAILDLYEGTPNQGMRCIRQILRKFAENKNISLHFDEFDVRLKKEVPGFEYDIYISTGGPGSPLGEEDNEWEEKYFAWMKGVSDFNSDDRNKKKKYVLFICHSFQMACRFFELGNVSKRKSTSFGVFPVHIVEEGKYEPVFTGLPDPFYAVDSRDYQVVEPDYEKIESRGASVLAIEKERPHVPLERAVMAVRFNDYMLGTQFHPEADPEGMTMYLQRQDKKDMVIENHGYEKWQSMIEQLNDPDKISWTYSHVIPNFLEYAMERLLIS